MGHATRTEGRVSRRQVESFSADLDDIFALDYVEPFVLVVVDVAWRSTLGIVCDLTDNERAAAVGRRNLEGQSADAEAAMLPEPVLALR